MIPKCSQNDILTVQWLCFFKTFQASFRTQCHILKNMCIITSLFKKVWMRKHFYWINFIVSLIYLAHTYNLIKIDYMDHNVGLNLQCPYNSIRHGHRLCHIWLRDCRWDATHFMWEKILAHIIIEPHFHFLMVHLT